MGFKSHQKRSKGSVLKFRVLQKSHIPGKNTLLWAEAYSSLNFIPGENSLYWQFVNPSLNSSRAGSCQKQLSRDGFRDGFITNSQPPKQLNDEELKPGMESGMHFATVPLSYRYSKEKDLLKHPCFIPEHLFHPGRNWLLMVGYPSLPEIHPWF